MSSTKSREVIWGGRIGVAKINAESARRRAIEAAPRSKACGSQRMVAPNGGYSGPAQPSPTIGQCLNGGLGWLEVECNHCKTRASIPLDAIRRRRDTPIWKLEAALKCRSCELARRSDPTRISDVRDLACRSASDRHADSQLETGQPDVIGLLIRPGRRSRLTSAFRLRSFHPTGSPQRRLYAPRG
jgi:hypothetical protein